MLQEERRRALAAKSDAALDASPKDNASREKRLESAPEAVGRPLDRWESRHPLNLEDFRVQGVSSVFYIPEWITGVEEQEIVDRVRSAPESAWVQLKHRRLQMYGGEVTTPFVAEPLPPWLEQIIDALIETKIFPVAHRPNHALINEYGVGDCILPHEDGPRYFPLVAIVSTSADAFVTFTRHRQHVDPEAHQQLRFPVKRRSLLLFTEDAYTKYLHGIDGIASGHRVSLTIRHVQEEP
ncbi:hypothetical protein P43SY_003413 [Pythium insidiosum]|uniref:Fe2OG dioxygenase domain-containing protein n=1 Tax=Pythium insidiosum TaxID=114742 RepID=A0AAD5LLA2_PYTIN|nr:hypothetical protein P43SY_003413 [Pythium insidiosum]